MTNQLPAFWNRFATVERQYSSFVLVTHTTCVTTRTCYNKRAKGICTNSQTSEDELSFGEIHLQPEIKSVKVSSKLGPKAQTQALH